MCDILQMRIQNHDDETLQRRGISIELDKCDEAEESIRRNNWQYLVFSICI